MGANTRHAGRSLLAIVLGLAALGLGLLAPYVPNFVPYVAFGWAMGGYLLVTGVFSMAFQSTVKRFLAAAIGGFLVLHTYPYSMTYLLLTDQMAPQMTIGPAESPAVLGLLGGLLSYVPALHCLWVEKKLSAGGETPRAELVPRGILVGLCQSGTVLLLVAPLFYLAPIALAISLGAGSQALLHPSWPQYLFFTMSTLITLLAAGTALGGIAGLIEWLAPTRAQAFPPAEDIADVLGPGPDDVRERSHLGGLTEVIRHR